MIIHHQLEPCTRGLALALGGPPYNVCRNCGKERLKLTYPVKFPGPPWANHEFGFVCSVCNRKYRNNHTELLVQKEDLVFVYFGRGCVAPTDDFFESLTRTEFIKTVVESYNNNGFISLKQYEAAIRITEIHNERYNIQQLESSKNDDTPAEQPDTHYTWWGGFL